MGDQCLPAGGGLQQRAIATITPLLPPDARDRVRRAINEYNRVLRNQIREETRLNLADDRGRGSVPIRIEDGFPVGVARLIDNHRDAALWRLIALHPALDRAASGLGDLIETWQEIAHWPHLPVAPDSITSLEYSGHLVNRLQGIAGVDAVFRELREIREDILGVYRFHPGPARIEIYWMAQAFFAAAFGLPIEDLTVVTLIHELAHAYTHLGRDIDGVAWRDPGFGLSDANVVEGLAQHITAVVTEQLKTRVPGGSSAYRELLKHQSGPYRAHEDWFSSAPERRSEIVRFAMLRARHRGSVSDADWREMLRRAARDLTDR